MKNRSTRVALISLFAALSIVLPMAGQDATAQDAVAGADSRAPAVSDSDVCAPPRTAARISYRAEEIEYDLGITFSLINNKQERIYGNYKAELDVDIETSFREKCLAELRVAVDVSPVIHLLKDYRDVRYRCARQSILDQERRHGPIVRRIYDDLPRRIENLASGLFAERTGISHKVTVEQLTHELREGPFITEFLEEVDAAQDAFRARERRDGSVVLVDCRRIKRPGGYRSLEARAEEVVLKCRDAQGNLVSEGLHNRTRGRRMTTLKCTRY